MSLSRRGFLKLSAAMASAGAMGAATGCQQGNGNGGGTASGKRVVVIGGGFGGATAAKYVKMFDDTIDVTMIDGKASHTTCPFSNLVIGGLKDIDEITHDFKALEKRGVNVVKGWVTGVDAEAQSVTLEDGRSFEYDRLVVSPGIDFNYDAIEGYTEEVANTSMPHAWQAGEQTLLLRRQLEEMEDGGTFILGAPPNPFRCPPGPYERAALVANYFKEHKPNSKILILDPKTGFSKEGLFREGWTANYGNMIEWIGGDFGGGVEKVDPDTMTVVAGGTEYKGDVINVIPPQKAGKIAQVAGLADDSGWCPVNQQTYESTIHERIHVVGDACIGSPMPKSGFSANSQAKNCAASIVAMFHNESAPIPSWVNTCYSLVAPDYGISVAAVYELKDGKTSSVEGAGGVSPLGGENAEAEAGYAHDWYASITKDIWGS
ncbi:FCSD flavin-binding domain-containing protein [Guyparkeria sp.]|uniref:FCSD flavin-binding domain-containing protein n=1 Tax=Guyparkeria sp. TaxID=2035736 RepID=UPI003970C21E